MSQATVAELIRALGYPKFKLSADEQRELLSDYLPYCAVVRMPARPPQTPPCRDPGDVPFLQLALVASAECLVTGDRDLLGLASRLACRIVTPAEWLRARSPG